MRVELVSITENAEKIIEMAGRTSYMSFDKVEDGSEKQFIKKLVQWGHMSIFEHVSASFRISEVSRALTHQLVRHRIGVAFTQKSQRYVSESNFTYVTPPSIEKNAEANQIYKEFMAYVQDAYSKLIKLDILKEDARYVLPNATETEIFMTANFREWRHIFKLRCGKHAQWEIRILCIKILEILKQKSPTAFEDFEIDYDTMTAKTICPD